MDDDDMGETLWVPAIFCFTVLQVKLMCFLCGEAYIQDMVRFFSHFWVSKMTEPLFPPSSRSGSRKRRKRTQRPS